MGCSAEVHARIRTFESRMTERISLVSDGNIGINEPETPVSPALPISGDVCLIKVMCLQRVTY